MGEIGLAIRCGLKIGDLSSHWPYKVGTSVKMIGVIFSKQKNLGITVIVGINRYQLYPDTHKNSISKFPGFPSFL